MATKKKAKKRVKASWLSLKAKKLRIPLKAKASGSPLYRRTLQVSARRLPFAVELAKKSDKTARVLEAYYRKGASIAAGESFADWS